MLINMFRYTIFRMAAFICSVVTLGVSWYYNTPLVNQWLDIGEELVRKFSELLAPWIGLAWPVVREFLVVKLHAELNTVLVTIMLVFMVVGHLLWQIARRMKDRFAPVSVKDTASIVTRVLFVYVFAHILLTVLWLKFPLSAEPWYRLHDEWIRTALRYMQWSKAESVARFFNLHSVVVTVETMLLITALWNLLLAPFKHPDGPIRYSR